jgi:predicted RecB family nuclease
MATPPPKPSAGHHPLGQNWPIGQLPGLHPRQQQKLQTLGITTTLQLLHQTHTPQQQQHLAKIMDVRPQIIQKWAAFANLARVPGVGCQYCGLLLHAGIASIAHLAQAHPPQLQQQLFRLQQTLFQGSEAGAAPAPSSISPNHLALDLCPSVAVVQSWIRSAQYLVVRSR